MVQQSLKIDKFSNQFQVIEFKQTTWYFTAVTDNIITILRLLDLLGLMNFTFEFTFQGSVPKTSNPYFITSISPFLSYSFKISEKYFFHSNPAYLRAISVKNKYVHDSKR